MGGAPGARAVKVKPTTTTAATAEAASLGAPGARAAKVAPTTTSVRTRCASKMPLVMVTARAASRKASSRARQAKVVPTSKNVRASAVETLERGRWRCSPRYRRPLPPFNPPLVQRRAPQPAPQQAPRQVPQPDLQPLRP